MYLFKEENMCTLTFYIVRVLYDYLLQVKSTTLTLRRLTSYIYGAPILDVSRFAHDDAAQSVGLLWTSDQLVAETST